MKSLILALIACAGVVSAADYTIQPQSPLFAPSQANPYILRDSQGYEAGRITPKWNALEPLPYDPQNPGLAPGDDGFEGDGLDD